MTAFYIYCILALATGLSAAYELFYPLVKQAQAAGVVNEITENPKLSIFVFIVVGTLTAPLLICMILVPALFISARIGMEREVMKENSDLK